LKPKYLNRTHEPDCEDNEAQAALREERSHAAAVDFSWIIRESRKQNNHQPGSGGPRKLLYAQASLPLTAPAMMIVERDQPPRKTRPPVPASQLSRHPYSKDSSAPWPDTPVKGHRYPRIKATFVSQIVAPIERKRRKRKRGKLSPKERPQPTFWRPNPACGGKSLGYAMGYPCSLGYWDTSTQYRRDTMRKGVLVDSLA